MAASISANQPTLANQSTQENQSSATEDTECCQETECQESQETECQETEGSSELAELAELLGISLSLLQQLISAAGLLNSEVDGTSYEVSSTCNATSSTDSTNSQY
jgi:hypothetical protein